MKTRGLLIRVGVDSGQKSGKWNAPCWKDGRFCYVPIPADDPSDRSPYFDHTYAEFKPFVETKGVKWPDHLKNLCHLDPDFSHLTYGDGTKRARRIRRVLGPGTFIVFWAGLRSVETGKTQCSIVGFYWVSHVMNAYEVGELDAHRNAHSRYTRTDKQEDVIVFASPGKSGRLERHIPIGEVMSYPDWKLPQQCVFRKLIKAWGGLESEDGEAIKHGYIQMSSNPPLFTNGHKFLKWWRQKKPKLIHANNT